ncbi:MAG: hypothetical protein A3C06_04295 [Candidatus Taylorbacteria bacterium RIFCSPHIGHO2_02_FULL_46_13]|uniref:Antitoxin VbhA domain-containing protein n=1 Tax=Candidatus Taylorbacteria bacterium RIFCSPHIGHO2_02_FULL_46_13 TaxID=1802312 RepID=A0A1G2MV48_9BACT|nr:MAG: hypothetical protein A3C06_04295 [Candidatus Taylorbacteria bacterium RIFCSPHIGHO2_02_FULL_46_13]
MKEGIEIANPEQENPQAVIEQLKGEVATMGRNDSEFSRFDEITGLLQRGECTPEEAIRMAREIRYGKQEH